jgi:hypothetical protein
VFEAWTNSEASEPSRAGDNKPLYVDKPAVARVRRQTVVRGKAEVRDRESGGTPMNL